jgi:hypothetical protein
MHLQDFRERTHPRQQAESLYLESRLSLASVVNATSWLGVSVHVQKCRGLPCTAAGRTASSKGAGTPCRRLCTEPALFPLVVREVAPWLGLWPVMGCPSIRLCVLLSCTRVRADSSPPRQLQS